MRRMMIGILAAIMAVPVLVAAQPLPPVPASSADPRQAGISAAIDSAAQGLLDQIESQPLTQAITVKDFLDRTGGRDELRADLARSDPVGGPRWLDEKTCQVRLEITGTELVADLANIAARHPDKSPLAAMDLPTVADGLSARWFAATGASTAAGVAPLPPADSPWMNVAPDDRRRAVAAANAAAIQNILTSLSAIELTPGHPVAEALDVPSIRRALTDWLGDRPVTAVEYRRLDSGHLQVEVTLAAAPADVFDTLRTTLTAAGWPAAPTDPAAWQTVRDEVAQHMAAPTGTAEPVAQPAAQMIVLLPSVPPAWTRSMADATGLGGPAISSLRAARAAEADAMNHLRAAVFALPLTPDRTIGQATQLDPTLARSVDRAIARGARLYASDYRTDGTVQVRVSLDLRFLWTEMTARP